MKPYLATLAALALLALSGCGDNGPSAQADPTSPSLTATASSSPTGPAEPTMPSAAYDQTKAGAIAFAKYYWALVDYAQATGDTSKLRALASKDCGPCDGGADWIDKIHAKGGTIRGGRHRLEVIGAELAPGNHSSEYLVAAKLSFTATSVRDAGKLDGRDPAQHPKILMTLSTGPQGWVVASWSGNG